jgi:hypothetical protein
VLQRRRYSSSFPFPSRNRRGSCAPAIPLSSSCLCCRRQWWRRWQGWREMAGAGGGGSVKEETRRWWRRWSGEEGPPCRPPPRSARHGCRRAPRPARDFAALRAPTLDPGGVAGSATRRRGRGSTGPVTAPRPGDDTRDPPSATRCPHRCPCLAVHAAVRAPHRRLRRRVTHWP